MSESIQAFDVDQAKKIVKELKYNPTQVDALVEAINEHISISINPETTKFYLDDVVDPTKENTSTISGAIDRFREGGWTIKNDNGRIVIEVPGLE